MAGGVIVFAGGTTLCMLRHAKVPPLQGVRCLWLRAAVVSRPYRVCGIAKALRASPCETFLSRRDKSVRRDSLVAATAPPKGGAARGALVRVVPMHRRVAMRFYMHAGVVGWVVWRVRHSRREPTRGGARGLEGQTTAYERTLKPIKIFLDFSCEL